MNTSLREASPVTRTLAVGPELAVGGTHFRLWAPKPRTVELAFFSPDGKMMGRRVPLEDEGDGYFSVLSPEARPGAGYKFVLDGGGGFPDPASHFQPDGPHGFSVVVDHRAFEWTDSSWRGVSIRGQVLYELHIGTFTSGGTYENAKEKLPLLR